LAEVEAMEVVDGTTAGATTTTMTTESLVAIQPSDSSSSSAAATTITDGFVEEQRVVSVQQVGVESTRVVDAISSSSTTTTTSTTLLTTGVEGDVARTEIATPVATFYTEAVRSVSGDEAGGETVVAEGFRVVGPQGLVVPDEVLEEAGHPENL